MKLDRKFFESIEVESALGQGPPYIAQCRVICTEVDLYGNEFSLVLDSAGMSFSHDESRDRCWSELTERYCASSMSTVRRLVQERSVDQEECLPWSVFASYGTEQESKFDSARPVENQFWCRANRLNGDHVLVPASRVILNWSSFVGHAAMAGECDASGLAAWRGDNAEPKAITHGFNEVLERDSLMLSWRVPGWPVVHLDCSLLDEEFAIFAKHFELSIRLFEVSGCNPKPVVLAIVQDQAGSVTCGSSCKDDVRSATRSAVLEAIMLRRSVLAHIKQLGSGSDPHEVNLSLWHVLCGYRNGGMVMAWYEQQAEKYLAGQSCPVLKFGGFPEFLSVRLDDGFGDHIVTRVLVPNMYRKEWDHALMGTGERLAYFLQGSDVHGEPHPFG